VRVREPGQREKERRQTGKGYAEEQTCQKKGIRITGGVTQEKREATEPSNKRRHALDADKGFAETVDAVFRLTRRKVTLDGRW
jgi:hypothetical protein